MKLSDISHLREALWVPATRQLRMDLGQTGHNTCHLPSGKIDISGDNESSASPDFGQLFQLLALSRESIFVSSCLVFCPQEYYHCRLIYKPDL